jgi:antitoxin component of MazEF toxin-antitoxin module
MKTKGKGKVLQVGNSKGVVIQAKFINQLGVKTGDKVKYVYDPQSGTVIYKFKGVIQLSLA